MAVHASSLTRVRFAAAVISAAVFSVMGALLAFVHAAPVTDGVSLSESTMTWSTAKYATDAENGFVSGSLDKKTIVDRTFKTYVVENRYLKVTLVPEFGFFPSFTSRPDTNNFIAPKSAYLTGSSAALFTTTG